MVRPLRPSPAKASTPAVVHPPPDQKHSRHLLAWQLVVSTPLPQFGPAYRAYKSPFGPQYKPRPHLMGWDAVAMKRYGVMAAGYGAMAGIFALFFFAEVPRVRDDIMIKVPIIGDYFVKEIPPEDNPF
ncbi:ubiquinol-cytochrome-c reductase complex subunit-domain-containing protein [Phyllosticta capitalensis]